MMKKTLALILAISLLSSFTIAHASTESDTVMDSGTVETQEKEEVAIGVTSITEASGSFGENTFDVDTYESFDFPGSFQIDPSAGELKGTPVEVTNAGETSINLTAELCKSMDSSSPSVVRPDHFADWTTLSTEDTTGNIAFGFLVKDEAGEEAATFWFTDEDSQTTEEVYTVAPGEAVTVEVIGKNGLSWEKACTLSYDCKVGIEVIPLEIVVEQPLEDVIPVEPEVIPEPEVPVVPEEPEQIPNESEVDTPTEDEGSTDNEQADLEDKETDVEQPEENTPAVEDKDTADDNIQEDVAELPDDAIVPTAPEDNDEQGQEPQEDTVPVDDVPVDVEQGQVDNL